MKSKISVVGIGPGNKEDMTPRAVETIESADLVVGYSTYIELIETLFPHKTFLRSGMRREVERCRQVLEKAKEGLHVALVSSGDSGIYGMAGIMLEVVQASGLDIPVEVIPGITAASKAASVLGAPLMHDFAVISLSDWLTPLELIYERIELAAKGDFVICFYNPKSHNRPDYIERAKEILLNYRLPDTPVGIVRNAGRDGEEYDLTTLSAMTDCQIDMFTTVIVGNSRTYIAGNRMVTPRGYAVDREG